MGPVIHLPCWSSWPSPPRCLLVCTSVVKAQHTSWDMQQCLRLRGQTELPVNSRGAMHSVIKVLVHGLHSSQADLGSVTPPSPQAFLMSLPPSQVTPLFVHLFPKCGYFSALLILLRMPRSRLPFYLWLREVRLTDISVG